MKHLNYRLFLFCIIAILPLPLSASQWYAPPPSFEAEGSQCPAPVAVGLWKADQMSGVIAKYFSPQGLRLISVPPPKATRYGNAEIKDCNSTFTFEFVGLGGDPLKWEMTLADWTNKNGVVYTGSTSPRRGVTVNFEWTAGNPYEAVGTLGITAGSGQGSPRIFLQSAIPTKDRKRYECGCILQLQAWLDKRKEFAVKLRDLYANPKYQKRPKGIPRDPSGGGSNWNTWVYDAVIVAMKRRKLTHAQAVRSVVSKYFPNGKWVSDSGLTKLKEKLPYAAYTDLEIYKIVYSEDHRPSCYPSLTHESTVIHEEVHKLACLRAAEGEHELKQLVKEADNLEDIAKIGRTSEKDASAIKEKVRALDAEIDARTVPYNKQVINHGKEEARAYQAQIDFLDGFISKNCK